MRKTGKGLLAVLLMAFLLLMGCSQDTFVGKETAKPDFQAEAMIVLTNERNRYEEVYTDQIWEVPVGTSGMNFEEYLVHQVEDFMYELDHIVNLAGEYGIVLDNEEELLVSQASGEYYNSLTASDRAYMGVEKEDVNRLYARYCLANKAVEELTRNIDLEVSDSEARVCEVFQIYVTDQAKAEEAYAQAQAEGADFESVAKKYSENAQIRRQMARGEQDAALEEAVFSLEDGQMSPVVEDQGGYSIFYSIEDYDEEATLLRKSEISRARKNTAFLMIYEEYMQEHGEKENPLNLEDIHFSSEDGVSTDQFFEVYDKYFTDEA